MKGYQRSDRVGDQIRAVLAEALLRDVSDSRLQQVSFTAVALSRDLQHARVYWVVLDPSKDTERTRKSIRRALDTAAGFFRGTLSRELDLRYTPALTFVWDESIDRGRRMDALLADIVPAETASNESRPEGAIDESGQHDG
jgi:ribosome-binding factor A